MSWPHFLSVSRIIAGPVVAALVVLRPGNGYLIAAVIFSAASLTDLVDGKLARYSQSVSPLGVFVDTTSDKILVALTLVGMTVAGLAPLWIVLLILAREYLISGLRSFAASCNRIISAHIWGKGKAAVTMLAIGLVLLAANGRAGGALGSLASHSNWDVAYSVSSWILVLAAILTVISGVRYIVDAWPLLRASAEDASPADIRRMVTGSDKAG
ncbi:MAG: CDP-diacylglycerol--glycerol-3-phosphate 3-phosphatidyltransferase [Chloroflexota bacterium]